MKIHFLRHASLVIESGEHVILLDPMMAEVGELWPLSVLRHKAHRNPLVPLPPSTEAILDRTNLSLITHCQRGHLDHLDKKGARFLSSRKLPTFCRRADLRFLRRRNIDARPLEIRQRQSFLDGYITPIPARHGHGWISSIMGPGVGFMIELRGEPTLYIAGDTVLTDEVRRVLGDLRPDIAIVAAGHASVDLGKPILMSLEEVMEFTTLASGRVVANHLEALNHCPISRAQLCEVAKSAGLDGKLSIPEDGDTIDFGGKIC